ncbi:hypothetical protein L6164_022529 [Bauhinia variegata]|uniref:Uncharacterized protein n=1 Tax=Bauhinia variegata TaxID=167791 RepID=A0ACB9MGX5_BAUVA|nr:hypothetical protein L6164_022529 [Bauhinia variegata]
MLALSSTLFSTNADALFTDQDPINYDQDYMQKSFVHFPSTDHPNFEHRDSPVNDADLVKVKKLNHNAGERDRRKKMNNLFSSLRSLLPANHQVQKNLSNPAVVSRVLEYIPQLQQQLRELIQKKEELLYRIASQREQNYPKKQETCTYESSLPVISSSQLNDTEILVQISTHKIHRSLLSETLLSLEYNGLSLLDASSFQSSGDMIFYSLHFEVQKNDRLRS